MWRGEYGNRIKVILLRISQFPTSLNVMSLLLLRVISCQRSQVSNLSFSRFAKMFYKGVSFTSDSSALTYLVDQAGTRTTSDNFSDLNGDFSVPVFLSDAAYGQTYIRECGKLLKQAQFWYSEEGIENWVINGIRISQTADGLVR